MTKTNSPNAGAASNKTGPGGGRRHLYIMVTQRLQVGVGPGPIHVTKKVLQEVVSGTTTKRVRVPVLLDHKLPAGTGTLTATDRRTFAEQGLSAQEIAYVESRLPAKKATSDAHLAKFETERAPRLRAKFKQRLLQQITADPQLADEVLSSLRKLVPHTEPPKAQTMSQRHPSLSEKVISLRALLAEVGRDIEAYKDRAKVGKTYNQDRLRSMLTADAAREWKLCWFAFSQMIDQATGTPFARPRGWASNGDLSTLAAAHGFKASA